jgi:tetrahydromethanopterin S-methyltransferase subunit D
MSQNEEGLRLRGGSGVGSGGAGGIGGTGVFGLFGTVVQCKSDDKSWYCMLAKFVNVLIMLMIIFFILSVVYNFLKGFSRKRFSGGVGRMSNGIFDIFS